jgi:hypothetical protein
MGGPVKNGHLKVSEEDQTAPEISISGLLMFQLL